MEKENFDKYFSDEGVRELCKKYNRSMDDFNNRIQDQSCKIGEYNIAGCKVKRFFERNNKKE